MMFRLIALAFCMAMGATPPVLAEDCAEATRLTREAEPLALDKRITAYQSARTHCPSDPKTHYRAGMALMASAQYPQAQTALMEALEGVTRQSAPPAMRLEILGRMAENEYRREARAEALARFKIAREFARNNQLALPAWMTQLQMDLDKQLDSQPLTATEMHASLRGMRDLGVEPTVDYRVLFDTGSDRLTPEAEQQLQKIADSLGAEAGNIRVIGHTDLRGTEEHNQKLSERRARRVAAWLADHNRSLDGRLSALGKGMTEPKYFGGSDEYHQMNRRVEFVFGGR
jgi:outer membrane protein OmpA-like peptidoglycan-associated protein